MSQAPAILVDIAADGSLKVRAQGVQGQSCQALTRELERALGKTILDQKTPEFYHAQSAAQGAKAHG